MGITKIEWTATYHPDGTVAPGYTFNPWRGCTRVSEGCRHCYAETMSKRNPSVLGVWGPQGTRVVASEAMWKQPVRWNREAEAAGERHRVFCASLADVFEDHAAVVEARARLWALIDATPWLDWLLLTKRPENIRRLWTGGYRQNVWRMTSVEDQGAADTRVPLLLDTNNLSPIAGLSCEPLLGPVNLTGWWMVCQGCLGSGSRAGFYESADNSGPCDDCRGTGNIADPLIHWVIVGGESGPGARPMHPEWARSLRDQCGEAGVAYFFKQWGEWEGGVEGDNIVTGPSCPPVHEWPDGHRSYRTGKHKAGRIIGGRTWDEYPAVAVPA